MLNKVLLIGRLTRDPELRYTQAGIPVASFSLAVDRPKSADQERAETDFIDIVAWRKLAETCANHIGKGRLVSIDGTLRVRSYETTDGQKRRAWEVVAENIHFLDRPKEGQQSGGGSQAGSGQGGTGYGRSTGSGGGQSSTPAYDSLDLDDDVPF